MIYIDTDVLVHAYVVQDEQKNKQANEVIEQVNNTDIAIMSTLGVQEMLYVLGKLGIDNRIVSNAYNDVMQLQPVSYDVEILRRSVDIAKHVGFKNINDCIHTAIAEKHCDELITYNKKDFSKIREIASVSVTILDPSK